MKNSRYWIILALIVAAIGTWYFTTSSSDEEQIQEVYTTPKQGNFEVTVMATGEVKAKNSEEIKGPASAMQSVGIYQTTISNIIPEGTLVKAGQFVAQLDQTELATKIAEVQSEIDKINTQMEQAVIDTTIDMRALRDEIKNLSFSIEEKELSKELNKFEPEAIIRQNEIDLAKVERDLAQKKSSLKLTKEKNNAKLREITASLRQQQIKMKTLTDLRGKFTVLAPTDGMVIYRRSWNGERQGVGASIRPWEPTVAELPDLTDFICRAFVNEVDINKISMGLDVKLRVDAFPDKEYTGQIIKVANIGENMRNYDSKVFEVIVQVNEKDSLLRPAMTAAAEIITDQFDRKMFIPLECVHKDSLSYVYIKEGNKVNKQEIITGSANENHVVVEHGLEGDETLFLSQPDGASELIANLIDLDMKSSVMRRIMEEKREIQIAKEEMRKSVKDETVSSSGGGGSGIVIF